MLHGTREPAEVDDVLPEGHPNLAYSFHGIGVCRVDLGRPELAIDPLESALSLRRKAADPGELGQTAFALARALWNSRADRSRAIELARQASEQLADVEPFGRESPEAHAVARWLERRAPSG